MTKPGMDWTMFSRKYSRDPRFKLPENRKDKERLFKDHVEYLRTGKKKGG